MIAFQGEPGAYSEAAALAFFGAQTETLPCDTFEMVFQAVDQGEVEHGLIPIENSLAGSIHRNYDLLLRYQIPITGEVHYRIRHCLLALPDVEMADLRRVMSHPQALAQCEQYLSRLNEVEIVVAVDTASQRVFNRDQPMFGLTLVNGLEYRFESIARKGLGLGSEER